MESINEKLLREEIQRVKDKIDYQQKLAYEIENTKFYRALESFHYWKSLNKSEKLKSLCEIIKHINKGKDRKIRERDPMSAIFLSQIDTKDKLDLLNMRWNIYVSFTELVRKIWSQKFELGGVICVFAPYDGLNSPDGYFRRVKNIDQLLPEKMLRIYISRDSCVEGDVPTCIIIDDKYISVKYDPKKMEQSNCIAALSKLVGIVYIHSIYQYFPAIICDKSITKIYDFHGVVPEELSLMGHKEMSIEMDENEMTLVKSANYIIVANNATKRHILTKYPQCEAQFVLMPMNNEDNDIKNDKIDQSSKIQKSDQHIVIYSGGLQKWQLIEEMQDAISQAGDRYEYHIFVPEPDKFLELWGERDKPAKWEIDRKTMEELQEEYRNAEYGFVLRDDIIVNNVACPTKLIDYIKYDIIPVMKSSRIGDFDEKGIEYIPLCDFIHGNIPTREEREEMCRKNKKILEEIMEEYRIGKAQIVEIIRKSNGLS